ncbi:MAG: helix-turn-helix domain-containing protein [Clostridia bacterium]|nr:helix-turn-helix domain-containing protein [Clostridia bacterium]
MIRIKEYRRACGMTAKQLACRVGVAESTMSLYENGKREPDFETLLRISAVLNVGVDALLGVQNAQTGIKIPVYGSVAAGVPIAAITDIEDYEEITEGLAATGEFAALRIRGDSMEPRMTEGDVVIVRVQEAVESGDVAIVLIGNEEATCKRVMKTGEGIVLLSTNPKYAPMFYSKDEVASLPVRIFGKVVELRAKF